MDRSKLQITEEQLTDWTKNPVTMALAELCREDLERARSTPTNECIVYGEPVKTHENLIELDTRCACEAEWVAFLEGDWTLLEDEDE